MTQEEIKALGPSIADLDREDSNQLSEEQKQAAIKAEATKQTEEKAKAEDLVKLQAEEKVAIDEIVATGKTPEEAKAIIEAIKNETPEQKAVREAKIVAEDAANAKTEQEDLQSSVAFFDRVNKAHGFEDFKVEYPENIDPGSEEGVHIREKALMERAELNFESYLKQKDPRGYAYLLHRDQGGDDESFFAKPSVTLPDYEVFKENVDLHKKLYVNDLRNKGVDEDVITAMVDKAIKEKKLFDKADVIYKSTDASEKKALADAEKISSDRQAAEKKAVEGTLNLITDIVTNNKTEKLQIPDTKKAAFNEYLKKSLMFDGENFFFVEPLSKENINKTIEHKYFAFVGGNLNDLVQRKAQTVVTNRFRVGVKQSAAASTTKGAQQADQLKDNVPIADL